MGRLVLLLTSPRVAPGLLTWPAWEVLRSADVVYAGDESHPQLPALAAFDVRVNIAGSPPPARQLVGEAAGGRVVVWLGGVDGDPGLGEALAHELTSLALPVSSGALSAPPELEILPGSYDLPGARLLDLINVMDRLRRECPWVQAQTHRSLVRYLVEESYETIDAIESGDLSHLREELGDLLFQVVFHARLLEEQDVAVSIDDVAGDLVSKLIRRNPHVFGNGDASSVVEIENVWDQLKAEEKRRTSVAEGVPLALPALALADKLFERTAKASASVDLPSSDSTEIGDLLLRVVARARDAGVDPEQALRDAIRRTFDLPDPS